MLLGEWWVANPTMAMEASEPPSPAERVPGTLQEVARGKFVLETIGFLGDQPFMAGGPAAVPDRSRPEIWGIDRDGTCYSLFDTLRSSWTQRPSHVSEGHEDWSVGWLAKGNDWVTSDGECSSARIRIEWEPIGYPEGGEAQVTETAFCASKKGKGRRVRMVVRRTRLTDPAQAQLWPDWRYHAFAPTPNSVP